MGLREDRRRLKGVELGLGTSRGPGRVEAAPAGRPSRPLPRSLSVGRGGRRCAAGRDSSPARRSARVPASPCPASRAGGTVGSPRTGSGGGAEAEGGDGGPGRRAPHSLRPRRRAGPGPGRTRPTREPRPAGGVQVSRAEPSRATRDRPPPAVAGPRRSGRLRSAGRAAWRARSLEAPGPARPLCGLPGPPVRCGVRGGLEMRAIGERWGCGARREGLGGLGAPFRGGGNLARLLAPRSGGAPHA